jgi:hypothetical protein
MIPYLLSILGGYFIGNANKNREIFANGGSVEFIEYKDEEIMFEPNENKYYANDNEFNSLEEAKKHIDLGSPKQSWQIDAYRKGLYAKGGITNSGVASKNAFGLLDFDTLERIFNVQLFGLNEEDTQNKLDELRIEWNSLNEQDRQYYLSAYLGDNWDDEFFGKGGGVKASSVEVGDVANVTAINKTGTIYEINGNKYLLRFIDGTKKTYDKSELTFYRQFAKGGKIYDSKEKKLKAVRKKGNIITFKKKFYPFGTSGNPYSQIAVKYIEKSQGHVKIVGHGIDSNWYDSMDDLLNAIDWEKMEKWHSE